MASRDVLWVDPLRALDRARASAWRLVARTRLLPWIARRDARASTRASLTVLLALAIAVGCPALALALSPILFGVAHVAASFRYLVLRQALSRSFVALTCALALAMMALRVLEQVGGEPARYARGEAALAALWALLAAIAAARARRSVGRLAIAAVLIAAGGAVALAHPTAARIAFVHVHNLAAPLLWLVAFRRGRFPYGAVGLLVGSMALLASGATVAWTEALGGARALGVDLVEVGRWLVPGAAASVAVPLVLVHGFTDSVHYAFWLGVVPDETARAQGTPTFRGSARALKRDFGALGLAIVVALVALVLVAACFNLAATRSAYFAIAGFHGYVEGAMLVFLAVRGRSSDAHPPASSTTQTPA